MGRPGVAAYVLVPGLLLLFALVASAGAITIRAGDLVIVANGGFTPQALPKDRDAPIVIYGGGRLATKSGSLPPILKTITIEFDRHGSLQTVGLPKCSRAKLVATTTKQARKLCPGAVVGKGFGKAVVKFPEQGPIPAASPITLFNGPRRHGNATVLAHAHLDYPGPTTFLVPVEIERIRNGVYGYRTEARIPRIAGGYGHPISGRLRIGREWTHRGRRHSYVNARCATGHLRARGHFAFLGGPQLTASFFRPCKVRR